MENHGAATKISRYGNMITIEDPFCVKNVAKSWVEQQSTSICIMFISDLEDFNPGESPEVEVKRVKLEDVPDILCRETLVTRPPTLLPLVKDENTYPELLYVIFYVEKFHTYVYFYRC
ncbi:hypothetical protein JTB14_024116 [Gonioctena quinquepunctata]|nr:hypothetical protein JTB14_024116 [Gonioctena quinquepunctata]